MKKRTAWILAAGVAAVALGASAVGLVALAVRAERGGGPFSSRSYLDLTLRGEIPEQPPLEWSPFRESRPPALRTLVESLDRAASDPSVTGVVLRVSQMPAVGWGRVQELRDALVRFRKSGKPAYAHLELCGTKEYYLASAASKVYALPAALLFVTGLEAEVTFLGGGLEKLGVEAQFEAVGKYKSAPDQYTGRSLSEPSREQLDALLDSLHGQFLQAVASARGKTPEEVQAALDAGPYDGPSALRAGLVDALLYEDQLDDKLERAARVAPASYVRSARGFSLRPRPRVAVVYVVGEILPGASQSGVLSGDVAGSDTVTGALRQARDDEDIRAVVLRVDSPGGSGSASEEIWREVVRTRQKKPVVVSMGDYAASGGYYVSMAGDAIVAQPGTLTGSIGVFSGKFALRGLYEKLGLSKEILTRGERAAMLSAYRPWTREERARVAELMRSFYDGFVERAAEGRRRKPEEIEQVAQGRVWTGDQAARNGLVDRLGGLETALAVARERAGIGAGQDVALVVLPRPRGFFETLLERQEDAFPSEALPEELRALWRTLHRTGSGTLLARLPFDLRLR